MSKLDRIRENLKDALEEAKIKLTKLDSDELGQIDELITNINDVLDCDSMKLDEDEYKEKYQSSYYDSGC